MDGLIVEIPLIAVVGLDHVVEEYVSPLGTDDCVPQFISNDWIAAVDVEVIEEAKAVCDLPKSLVVVLVHGGRVDTEIASHVVAVVAGSCQGYLSSYSVPSQCCH